MIFNNSICVMDYNKVNYGTYRNSPNFIPDMSQDTET